MTKPYKIGVDGMIIDDEEATFIVVKGPCKGSCYRIERSAFRHFCKFFLKKEGKDGRKEFFKWFLK